jgi:hypothetical protein
MPQKKELQPTTGLHSSPGIHPRPPPRPQRRPHLCYRSHDPPPRRQRIQTRHRRDLVLAGPFNVVKKNSKMFPRNFPCGDTRKTNHLHGRIVVVTSLVVAGTASAVSKRFDGFSRVGGIVGTSVSATFLIVLGIMNLYILHKLVKEMKKQLQKADSDALELKFEGAGCLFAVLKKLFRMVDR